MLRREASQRKGEVKPNLFAIELTNLTRDAIIAMFLICGMPCALGAWPQTVKGYKRKEGMKTLILLPFKILWFLIKLPFKILKFILGGISFESTSIHK